MTHHADIHGPSVLRELLPTAEGFGYREQIEDMIEFVGPFTAKIGDQPYITFTQYGVKEEGASVYPNAEARCWTRAEAMWRFRRAFVQHLGDNPARQLAWRQKPTLEEMPDGDFVVRCRFALLARHERPLKAVA